MRSLELDSFRPTLLTLLAAALLLIGWTAWFLLAEVSLYAVTDHARLEMGEEALVVAEFAPSEPVGRVRPRQVGRLRLEGFPPARYGMVSVTVSRVAKESQNGRVRVELVLDGTPDLPVSMQQSLPGTLEIEVERVSPAQLVLRAIGRASFRSAGEATASR